MASKDTYISARAGLEFAAVARAAFRFLSDRDFIEIYSSENSIVFKNDQIRVEVYHELLSYQIGLQIRYLDTKLSLADILREVDLIEGEKFMEPLSSTSQGVSKSLKENAGILKRYGASALAGDKDYYSRMRYLKKIWASDYWADINARQIRPRAELAFRKADYTLAAKLYTEIYDSLTPAENKKLSLAIKRSTASQQ
jgi:hypothetical protein